MHSGPDTKDLSARHVFVKGGIGLGMEEEQKQGAHGGPNPKDLSARDDFGKGGAWRRQTGW